MIRRWGWALACWLVLGMAQSALAQEQFHGCIDFKGRNVLGMQDDKLNYMAQADYLGDGWPIIRYNRKILLLTLSTTRLFFDYHECAHHVLGHLAEPTLSSSAEELADCWAVNTLFHRDVFKRADIESVQRDIASFKDDDWRRVGPRRKVDLLSCLQ